MPTGAELLQHVIERGSVVRPNPSCESGTNKEENVLLKKYQIEEMLGKLHVRTTC